MWVSVYVNSGLNTEKHYQRSMEDTKCYKTLNILYVCRSVCLTRVQCNLNACGPTINRLNN